MVTCSIINFIIIISLYSNFLWIRHIHMQAKTWSEYYFLLHWFFPTQGSNQLSPAMQAKFLPLGHLRNPFSLVVIAKSTSKSVHWNVHNTLVFVNVSLVCSPELIFLLLYVIWFITLLSYDCSNNQQ